MFKISKRIIIINDYNMKETEYFSFCMNFVTENYRIIHTEISFSRSHFKSSYASVFVFVRVWKNLCPKFTLHYDVKVHCQSLSLFAGKNWLERQGRWLKCSRFLDLDQRKKKFWEKSERIKKAWIILNILFLKDKNK